MKKAFYLVAIILFFGIPRLGEGETKFFQKRQNSRTMIPEIVTPRGVSDKFDLILLEQDDGSRVPCVAYQLENELRFSCRELKGWRSETISVYRQGGDGSIAYFRPELSVEGGNVAIVYHLGNRLIARKKDAGTAWSQSLGRAMPFMFEKEILLRNGFIHVFTYDSDHNNELVHYWFLPSGVSPSERLGEYVNLDWETPLGFKVSGGQEISLHQHYDFGREAVIRLSSSRAEDFIRGSRSVAAWRTIRPEGDISFPGFDVISHQIPLSPGSPFFSAAVTVRGENQNAYIAYLGYSDDGTVEEEYIVGEGHDPTIGVGGNKLYLGYFHDGSFFVSQRDLWNWFSNAWSTIRVDENVGSRGGVEHVKIQVDADGVAHIVYFDAVENRLKYTRQFPR